MFSYYKYTKKPIAQIDQWLAQPDVKKHFLDQLEEVFLTESFANIVDKNQYDYIRFNLDYA